MHTCCLARGASERSDIAIGVGSAKELLAALFQRCPECVAIRRGRVEECVLHKRGLGVPVRMCVRGCKRGGPASTHENYCQTLLAHIESRDRAENS